jgi:hypothetical protein
MAHNDIWQKILTLDIFQESCEEKTKHIIINLCSSSTIDIFLDNYSSIVNSETHILKIYFLVICGFNSNLEIIKYLIENQKMNINHTDIYGNNCLTMACLKNTNLEIIRYLIEGQKMNINHANNNRNNCLTLACWGNTNLEIIRYLIEEQKMNINHANTNRGNCLTMACWRNTNLEIIKYLIENQKMNINHVNNYGNNCLILACRNNTNPEVIKYLIENTDKKITIKDMPEYSIWEKIILGITRKWDRYSDMFDIGIKKYDSNDIAKIVKVINPLLLVSHSYLYSTHNIYNPFDEMCKYKDYAKHVEDLKFPVSLPVLKTEVVVNKAKRFKYDYRENNMGLIFIYNNDKYYGHRERVYDSIMCLKEIKEIADFDEPITLTGTIPIYVMNMWIESMYTKVFDITEIQPSDIICFLKHIDQYPTDILSIDKIEQNLIEYFDMMQYNVSYDMYLRDTCHKYKLKRLYLCLHNKKMENIETGSNHNECSSSNAIQVYSKK